MLRLQVRWCQNPVPVQDLRGRAEQGSSPSTQNPGTSVNVSRSWWLAARGSHLDSPGKGLSPVKNAQWVQLASCLKLSVNSRGWEGKGVQEALWVRVRTGQSRPLGVPGRGAGLDTWLNALDTVRAAANVPSPSWRPLRVIAPQGRHPFR